MKKFLALLFLILVQIAQASETLDTIQELLNENNENGLLTFYRSHFLDTDEERDDKRALVLF